MEEKTDNQPQWHVSEIIGPERLTITKMAEEDRPREKLMAKGPEALSDAELLAILIGGGTTKETAVELMQHILHDCQNNLAMLGKMSIRELMEYHGIGEARAISIVAACELGKRRQRTAMPERPKMDSAQKIYEYLHPLMRDLDVEEAYVLLMNQNFKLIKHVRLSHGGITETAVDVRIIMTEALLAKATIIALAHNHPSGNTRPSRDDDMLTKRVAEACRTMRIHLADHIVVTDGDYYSYRENGKL